MMRALLGSLVLLWLVSGRAIALTDTDTLRGDADAMGFAVGSVIAGAKWARDRDYQETLAREFNSAQAVVFMKVLQPEQGRYNWSVLDRQVEYARANKLRLMGHALIYRRDTLPAWAAALRSPERLEQEMRDFIQAVVRRGGDAFFAWQVVNEPISTPNQPWERAFGREGYIERAFRYAREAAPNAVLMINQSFRREGVDPAMTREFFTLVNSLKAKGVSIDAVGVEMHLEAHRLRPRWLEEFGDFLDMARDAGVLVYVTEMDVYQGPAGKGGHPTQVEVFEKTLAACLEASHCRGFYTWGVSDRYTWLRTRGRSPYPDAAPLLFDDDYRRKPTYDAVRDSLRRAREAGITKEQPWQ